MLAPRRGERLGSSNAGLDTPVPVPSGLTEVTAYCSHSTGALKSGKDPGERPHDQWRQLYGVKELVGPMMKSDPGDSLGWVRSSSRRILRM